MWVGDDLEVAVVECGVRQTEPKLVRRGDVLEVKSTVINEYTLCELVLRRRKTTKKS